MFTFRTSITFAVMAFVGAGSPSDLIQFKYVRSGHRGSGLRLHGCSQPRAFGRLQTQVAEISSLVRVLSTSSTLADSDERTDVDRGIALFTAALLQMPQADSIYVAYGNGSFLQVRRVAGLNDEQRATLRAPASAAISISLIRPASDGTLPMRRIFEDEQGNQIEQLDLWKYDYDARKRRWYLGHHQGRPTRHFIALRLVQHQHASDNHQCTATGNSARSHRRRSQARQLQRLRQQQRPGAHGTAVIFDSTGTLIAHPDLAQFVAAAHTSGPTELPTARDIKGGLVAAVLRRWDGQDQYNGSIRDDGSDYFFRFKICPG